MIGRSEELIDWAQKSGVRCGLAVVGADDTDTIRTVRAAWDKGVIRPTLIGPADKIRALAREAGVDVGLFNLSDQPDDFSCIHEAIRLVREGECEVIMKGRVKTADLMGLVLNSKNNLRTDRIVSHVGAFTVPDEKRIMLITDAGINISPDLERKQDIIMNAVQVAHSIGIECPRVAVLSFIEKIDTKDLHAGIRASTEDAEKLTEMNRQGQLPGCIVEGPYALDNAISMYAAKKKGISGKVAGQADILIAHDINMGNAIYKSLQIWVKTVMAGVVVGSKTPVVVPSRTDSAESKLQSIGLALHLKMYGARE